MFVFFVLLAAAAAAAAAGGAAVLVGLGWVGLNSAGHRVVVIVVGCRAGGCDGGCGGCGSG